MADTSGYTKATHDTTEVILAMIEEQKINLLMADIKLLNRNHKLLALATCDVLAIKSNDEKLALEKEDSVEQEKKNLVAIYGGGTHENMVLKTTS